MKPSAERWSIFTAVTGVAVLLAALMATAPKHPAALIRVVDVSGKPVAGAIERSTIAHY